MNISSHIYGSWKEKQIEKYEELIPHIGNELKNAEMVLDIGVGKAWLWKYLREKGYSFSEVTGVDVCEKATEPEKEYVNYIYSNDPKIDSYFDLVVAFDSVHLIDYSDRLVDYVCEDGYLLQSVPFKFQEKLKKFKDMKKVKEGEIGEKERDIYLVQKKVK